MSGKRVIIVTDGDMAAKRAVEVAAQNVGGRCISLSGGHQPGEPFLQPEEIVGMVLSAPHDPVIVMVDDTGKSGEGQGEKVLKGLIEHSEIDVIGVVAVASNSPYSKGVHVDTSVTKEGIVVAGPVNKKGYPQGQGKLVGDTVGILEKLDIPIIIGLGDPGKMDYADDAGKGAPITTKALQTIIKQAGKQRVTAGVGADTQE